MFPRLPACEVSDEAIDGLLELMRERSGRSTDNALVPAGFTYLGQFIDHDITFDAASRLDGRNDPRSLDNFRTPRLDLDSVYGSGPVVQPFLYDWKDSEPPGVRLLLDHHPGHATRAAEDLPRNRQGRALVGDARNDEHVIVAQLHLLFIRFHNAVVDRFGSRGTASGDELFEEARRVVRWHYQWIVVHHFLPKVAGDVVAREALEHRRHFRTRRDPFIPVEFSGAAYRFGHSMVRAEYGIKRRREGHPPPRAIKIFPGLAGFTWLLESLVIDWERFFVLAGVERPPQSSQTIDTAIARPLFKLPDSGRELPRLNLLRGRALGLPSGQDVACAMGERPLSEEELRLGETIPNGARKALLRSTPLWYYVLCEAETAGTHLGPVGGRIVAEVLTGLLLSDPGSYLSREQDWAPEELGTGGDFTMADLVEIAQRP